jgi:hypothetical protein
LFGKAQAGSSTHCPVSRPPIIALIAFLLSLAYAITRYIVHGTVAVEQLPLYVFNKAVALTGLGLLALARFVRDRQAGRAFGLIGASLTGLHALLSLMILQPAYLPKFYNPLGKMTGTAELSMLAGGLGLGLLAIMLWSAPRREGGEAAAENLPSLTRAILAAAALHSFFMGYSVWRTPNEWPGGLPPMTLISFLVAVAGVIHSNATKKAMGHNSGILSQGGSRKHGPR